MATRVIVAIFDTQAEAETAVAVLCQNGFSEREIGIISKTNAADIAGHPEIERGEEHAGDITLVGVAAGAGLGALVGLGVMSGFVPVIGPALAGGTFGVIFSNATVGAAVVGAAAALASEGVPPEEAAGYERELQAGRTLVTVSRSNRPGEAETLLQQSGGKIHVHS